MDKNTVRVVGAAIIKEGMILVAQRKYNEKAYKSLKWEFPGGKIEPGETKKDAIRREITEELRCSIEVDSCLPEIEYEYPDFIIRMTVCLCHLSELSEPKCVEHNCIRWVTPEEMGSLDWAAADACCYPLIAERVKPWDRSNQFK